MKIKDLLRSKRRKKKEEERFLTEVNQAASKYLLKPNTKLVLKEEDGSKTNFLNLYPAAYNICSQILTPWDRRRVIYKKLDILFKESVPFYLYVNRLVEDRFPAKAIEILDNTPAPYTNKDLYYLIYAKTLCILGEYEKSLEMAHNAIRENKENMKAKILIGDANYFLGNFDNANKIYEPLLNKNLVKFQKKFKQRIEIIELFTQEENSLSSPILAIKILVDNLLPEEAWKLAEDEFYYSPYFRCKHAYWIIKEKGDIKSGLSKLLALVREMPWIKEAVLTSFIILEKIDPNGRKGIFKEEKIKMEDLIKQNDWSIMDIKSMDVDFREVNVNINI